MKKVIRIDDNGYFISDVILEDSELMPLDCIENLCPDGFYKPRWNGIEWVEGLTLEEINAIKNTVQPKTELEILKETVDMLVLSSLGV